MKKTERLETAIRQKQIKQAVLEIIAQEGLHNLSTRNLAKKVGLTEGAIFRHFPTKRDIIKGIMEDVENELVAGLKEIANGSLPPEEKLFNFLCYHVQYLKANRGITILLFSEATHLGDKELIGRLRRIFSDQKGLIAKIIKEGISENIWEKNINPSDVATLYMGIPITFNIEYILNKKGINMKNFCRRMYELVINVLQN